MKKAILSILLILTLVFTCGLACSEPPSSENKYDGRFVVEIVADKDCGKVKGVNAYARYEKGTVLNISVTPKEGYKILSILWNGENVDVETPHGIVFEKTVSKNSTLKVIYEKGYYQAFVLNDNEKGTLIGIESGGSYKHGALYGLTATAKEGYIITSVLINNQPYAITDNKNYTFQVAINATMTIEVKYAYNLKTINIENDNEKGEIIGLTNGEKCEPGVWKTIYITPKEAYEIESISWNGVLESLTDAQKSGWQGQKQIAEDATLVVIYKKIKAELAVENDNQKGMVSGVINGQLFDFDADIEISVSPRPGHIIESIKWNGLAEVITYEQQKYGYTFIAIIDEDSTLEVTYAELKKQVVITNDSEKGTVSGVSSGYEYGINEGLIIFVTPKSEYIIKSVKWNGVLKTLSQEEQIEGYSFYVNVGETNTLAVEYELKTV